MARLKHFSRGTGEPIKADYIEALPDHLTTDGQRIFQGVNFSFSKEIVERMRAGYICCKCFEALDAPFPDNCPVCKFPMRDRQTEALSRDYLGEIRMGPSTTLDEEREIMNEMREMEREQTLRRLGITIPKPSIIVPRDV